MTSKPPPAELDAEAYEVAKKVSRSLHRKYPGRVGPGELLTPAYFGAVERPAHRFTYAYRRCVDYLRERDGRTRDRRNRVERAAVSVDGFWCDDGDRRPDHLHPAAPAAVPTPLEVWAAWWPHRRRWPLRARVWLYLYVVEGMTMAEVAAAVGVHETAVSKMIRRWAGEGVPA